MKWLNPVLLFNVEDVCGTKSNVFWRCTTEIGYLGVHVDCFSLMFLLEIVQADHRMKVEVVSLKENGRTDWNVQIHLDIVLRLYDSVTEAGILAWN